MKLKLFILFITTITLISCASNKLIPLVTETIPPLPTSIPTNISTPYKTATVVQATITVPPTVIITPTLIFPPYSTKQVFLEYGNEGGFGKFNAILGRTSNEKMVLYTDGQLIISKDEQLFEKILSPSEMEQIIFQMTKKDFYALETNQSHDETDKLYDFGNQYNRAYDGQIYYLSLNGSQPRTICYYGPYEDFLIPQAKDLFQYIEDYIPNSMMPYQPDRVLLETSKGTNLNSTNEQPISSSWPSNLPSLETSDRKFIYLEGKSATEVFSFFNHSSDINFLDKKGDGYTVSIHIVLPHVNLQQPPTWVCSK